ncbi:SAM-dependent methyltransferase [Paenibacillus campi]|uniref:SAM-dependent methyltransferase n=1 Tax=Paenibacillus campi TaxID=3106031 RepID=UPI002AFDD67E|nr:SAM-dependent methyltransferase [Paenibacillus sp. SGZ-1014]
MTKQSKQRQRYRFSEAPIWQLLRTYYERHGLDAWRNDQVPQYVTSNPMIAAAYVDMIVAFLLDRKQQGGAQETIYIVEIGAGAGRLAAHMLHELCRVRDEVVEDLPSFCYVMTDLAADNVAAWQQHPALQTYIAQGVLDFARFDALSDTELTLAVSGHPLRAGGLQEPIVLVANYFFDSLPQELIRLDHGQVYEAEVELDELAAPEFALGTAEHRDVDNEQHMHEQAKMSAETNIIDTTAITDRSDIVNETDKAIDDHFTYTGLSYTYRHTPAYEQPDHPYADLLTLYREQLEDAYVLLPLVSIDCLQRLNALSTAGFVLITADKGEHLLDSWNLEEPPQLTLNGGGGFSLNANYHAIGYVFQQQGAQIMFPPHHYNGINVGCMLHVAQPRRYSGLRLAYDRAVARFGPDDFYSLKQWMDERIDELELPQWLAFWRLGNYDAEFFIQSTERISLLLPEASDEEMLDLLHGIRRMWSSHYAMAQRYDLALDTGLVLFEMERYEEARSYLEQSIAEEQDDVVATVFYCLAICCLELGAMQQASEYLERLLQMEPQHEEALGLIEALQADDADDDTD